MSAATCQAISSGTGFAVAPGYVVTNAHVVAGADTVRVGLDGNAYDAAPVLFDPDLDVALLYAPGLPAPPLSIAATDPMRGATGATFGFPGGGGLKVLPAAVAGMYPAQGRDIYGEQRVTGRSSSSGRRSTRATAADRSSSPTGPSAAWCSLRRGRTTRSAMR